MKQAHHLSRIVISTALGPAGRGIFPYTLWPDYLRFLRAVRATGTTVFTKSATRFRRGGNFRPANPFTWKYIQRLPRMGMLNAYGLTNRGVEALARQIAKSLRRGWRVIPNFYPEFAKGLETAAKETLQAIEIYRQNLGPAFSALELNFSCPNSQEAIRDNIIQGLTLTRRLRECYPNLYLVVKLSVVHPYEFAQELEALGVSALHAVNSIPYELVFPGRRSPLWQAGGGGVSGGPAFRQACAYNAGLRTYVKVPLIMGGGVTCREDVHRYFDLGADAVSLCTLALRHPREAEAIVRRGRC